MNFRLPTPSSAAPALLAVGCGGSDGPDAVINVLPAGFAEHGMQPYGASAAITAAHVPNFTTAPAAGDVIVFTGGNTIRVPN
ncbi:MAG: hypothetical protein IH627_03905 [Rubrivivax sp.]|nr:hypothetical protein [Rubrivivax sp.]